MDDKFGAKSASTQTTNLNNTIKKSIAEANTSIKTTEINIIENYDWTLSTNKKLISKTIPYILLREKKLVTSNIAMSLFSSLFALPDALASNRRSVGTATAAAAPLLEQARAAAPSLLATTETTLKDISDLIAKTSNEASQKIQNTYNRLLEQYKSTSPDFDSKLQNVLGLLYLTKSTGNVYKLPHFTNDLFSIDNSFQDSYQQPYIFGDIEQTIKEYSEKFISPTALTEPGTYIQRPKFYNFSSTGASLNIQFTLFNTLNEMMFLQNSQLITKLILANTSRRIDKVTVKPPCLYEVTVPGKAFYPYCYVKSLKVEHVGVKRLVKNSINKQAIVPDAYSVNITVESLVSDINNLYEQQQGNAGMNLDENEVFNFNISNESNTQNTTRNVQSDTNNIISPYDIPEGD